MSKLKTRLSTAIEQELTPEQKLLHWQTRARELQTENETLQKQLGGDQSLFEHIKSELKELKPYTRLPIPKYKPGEDEQIPAIIITDTHSDELVVSSEMEGLAEHNYETFCTRMSHVADKTISITSRIRESANVRHLEIWLLGDFFLGGIHPEEIAYGQSMTLPQALPATGRVLADTIMRMARGFETVKVTGIVGNHGRTTTKPVFKMTADRNWDMSVYLIAQELTRAAGNVTWVLPKSLMHVTSVFGWRELLTHGNVCNITHRTPYFGIEDSMLKQRDSRRGTEQDFDHVWMGHFHHQFKLRGFINGCPSMIGANQFSQYRMHCASVAEQQLVFFSEKRGINSSWPINLD